MNSYIVPSEWHKDGIEEIWNTSKIYFFNIEILSPKENNKYSFTTDFFRSWYTILMLIILTYFFYFIGNYKIKKGS